MSSSCKKMLLVGGKGMLAKKVLASAPSEYAVTAVDLPEFDMTDRAQVLSFVDDLAPQVIVNCAAYTNVDGCESERELANQVNSVAVGYLVEAATQVGATLVHISTDYVFDGEKQTPYVEDDPTNPQSAYGHSKLLGEKAILESGLDKYFIIRTSWLYGPGGNNFVETIIRLAKEREELGIVADQVGSPTYTGDLAEAIYTLLALEASLQTPVSRNGDSPQPGTVHYGIYHFSNNGQCSWYEFSKEIVALLRQLGEPLKVETIRPIKTEEYPLPAKRPAYSVFSKDKYCEVTGASVPDWKESLRAYFEER